MQNPRGPAVLVPLKFSLVSGCAAETRFVQATTVPVPADGWNPAPRRLELSSLTSCPLECTPGGAIRWSQLTGVLNSELNLTYSKITASQSPSTVTHLNTSNAQPLQLVLSAAQFHWYVSPCRPLGSPIVTVCLPVKAAPPTQWVWAQGESASCHLLLVCWSLFLCSPHRFQFLLQILLSLEDRFPSLSSSLCYIPGSGHRIS